MISRAMSKAVKQAGKQQQANTRGLSGNRNSQGDFMPEDVQMKGVQDSVTPDIQNYVDNVKAQIDEIDAQINRASEGRDDVGVDTSPGIDRLIKEKRDLLIDLRETLRENGIEMPEELKEILADAQIDSFDPAVEIGTMEAAARGF
jgi:hypothetical protein